jgi:glutaredoxin
MYSTSWCGYCARARTYFKQNNIPFTERDIEKSAKAQKIFNDKYGGGGVPLLVYSGKTMRGFTVSRFDAFYSRRN